MAGRFVRASKYRHVFGKPTRKESTYDNLHISRNAWDTNLVKVNPEYLAVNWEASGGGAFAVIPLNEKGRLPEQIPLFRGHTAPVLDTDWNPFNDSVIASGSDDGKVFIWQVPKGFSLYSDAEEPADVSPVAKLTGHSRKVGQVLFNPAAENILASASGDYTIKIWDIESGQSNLTLKHKDIVQSLSWSADGNLMVTTSRDKKLRIWDVRQERAAHEVAGHSGAKNSRAVWMGEHNRVATTGFSKMSDRQMALWDVGSPSEPIGGFEVLDSISGVCMPFWDDGTQCLYLAGKGDGNIRYFEYENDKFEFLSEYKSGDPQRGLAFMPRRGINLHENEVMRAYKTVNDAYIEPISFVVPRRAEVFQSDIYPPAVGTKPGVSGLEWLQGKTALPPKIDLESIYEGNAPVEVAASAPSSTVAPARAPSPKGEPVRAPSPVKQPEPVAAPVQHRTPPPTMSEQKGSIAAMASKFQDNEAPEHDEDDDASSFEEIQKPVVRQQAPAVKPQMQAKPASPIAERRPISVIQPKQYQQERPTQASTPPPVQREEPVKLAQATQHTSQMWSAKPPSSSQQSSSSPSQSQASQQGPSNSAIVDSLAEIKELLSKQTMTITAQSEQIMNLGGEVEMLKKKLGSGTMEQNERIRQLELELEAARS